MFDTPPLFIATVARNCGTGQKLIWYLARSGRRYHRPGADENGDYAPFVGQIDSELVYLAANGAFTNVDMEPGVVLSQGPCFKNQKNAFTEPLNCCAAKQIEKQQLLYVFIALK